MSSNTGTAKPIKYKKVKPSVAEGHFKEKYQETRWLLEQMGRDPNNSLDKSRHLWHKKNASNFGNKQRLSGSFDPFSKKLSTDHMTKENGSPVTNVNMQTNITINQILLN